MNFKTKNRIINIFIVLISVFVLSFACIIGVGSLKTEDNGSTINVYASGEIGVMKKNGLLNLINNTNDFSAQEIVEISTKEDAILVTNSYFENLILQGGYVLESNMIIVGTADVLGGITAYQAAYLHYEVDENRHAYGESITCEIPSPSGNLTGEGENSGKKSWDDGTTITKNLSKNSNYTLANGKYILSSNYDGCQTLTETSQGVMLLPFVISNESVDSCTITQNTLTYTVTLQLNSIGYEKIAKESQEQAGAKDLPSFEKFEVKLTIDKWGNVVSIQTQQNFTIVVSRLGMNISSNTTSTGIYEIKKSKKD